MGGIKSHKFTERLTRRHAKQFLHKISKIKTWQFILILIPCFFLTITFFRFDHLRMDELRHAVITAVSFQRDCS